MINYEWDCKTVDVYTSKDDNVNVIYNVHWRVTGEGSEAQVLETQIGTQSLDTEKISEFVEFGSLAHETIVQWVKDCFGEEKVQEIEESIAKRIQEKITPSTLTLTIETSEVSEEESEE